MPSQFSKPEEIRPGASIISARTLNMIVRNAIRQLTGGGGTDVQFFGDRAIVTSQHKDTHPDITEYVAKFVVLEELEDLLKCASYEQDNDGQEWTQATYDADRQQSTEVGNIIYVAKPHNLQATFWDGMTVEIDGNEYVYSVVNGVRTATPVSAGTEFEETIAPAYLQGELIFALRNVTGIIGPDGNHVGWIALNESGRKWEGTTFGSLTVTDTLTVQGTTVTPVTALTGLTADQPALSVPAGTSFTLSSNSSSPLWQLQGFNPTAGAQPGRTFTIVNTGTNPITLAHLSGSATAGRRLSLPGGVNRVMLPGESYGFTLNSTLDGSNGAYELSSAGQDSLPRRIAANATFSIDAGTTLTESLGAGAVHAITGGTLDLSATALLGVTALTARWQAYTINFNNADFNIPATSAATLVFSLAAGGVILRAFATHTQFAAPGLASANVDVGTVAAPTTVFSSYNAFAATPSSGAFTGSSTSYYMFDGFTAKDVKLTLTCNVNLNTLTAGSVTLYFLVSDVDNTGAPYYLPDGDYGDIVVSGSGTVMTIDAGAVDTTKLGGDITSAGKALLDDANVAAQRTTLGLGTAATLAADTDTTLAANSDSNVPTQKAVKTYVDNAVVGLLDFKGSTDTSTNPNYPAALKGDTYVVSVAGRIGGASGKQVSVGDFYIATADNAGGTEAAVGTSWTVLENNLVGALIASNNLSDLADATTARANLGLTIGTHVQAFDADLSALAGLGTAADTLPYFTGSATANLTTFTAFARSLLDDVDATAARATLGVRIGNDVQAYSANLDSLAAISATGSFYYHSAVSTWTAVTIGAGLDFTSGTLSATGGLNINGLTADEPALSNEVPVYRTVATVGNKKVTWEKVGGLLAPFLCGGRISGSSTAASGGGVTASGTLYLLPFVSNRIILWDGTRLVESSFSSVSKSLTGLSNGTLYYVFALLNAGTLELEFSTSIPVLSDGIYYKTGPDLTRLYLGCFQTDSGAATVTDDVGNRNIASYWNPLRYTDFKNDTTDSWTNTGNGTWSTMNGGNAAWTFNGVHALAGLGISADATVYCTSSGQIAIGRVGVGVDRTRSIWGAQPNVGASFISATYGETLAFTNYTIQGYQSTYSSTTATFYGDNGGGFGGGSTGINSGMRVSGWR